MGNIEMERILGSIIRKYGDVLAFSYYLTKGLVPYIVERLADSGTRCDWYLSTVGVFMDCHEHLSIDIVHHECWLRNHQDRSNIYLYDNVTHLAGIGGYDSAILAVTYNSPMWMKRFIVSNNLSSTERGRIFDLIWTNRNAELLRVLSEVEMPLSVVLPPGVREMRRIICEWGNDRFSQPKETFRASNVSP